MDASGAIRTTVCGADCLIDSKEGRQDRGIPLQADGTL
jgi:hypothetical protein